MNNIYLDYVNEGREWSWALICLLLVIGTLVIRSLVLSGVLSKARRVNRKWAKRAVGYYERRSIVGWILFLIFIVGTTLLWRYESHFLEYLGRLEWLVIFLSFLVLGLVLHLRAYAQSIIDGAHEQAVQEKER